MNTLFPIGPDFPPGFTYHPDFLDIDEETVLYKEISKVELHNFKFQGFKANRKVASFGYDYSFDNGSLTKGKDIPPVFNYIINKVSNYISTQPNDFSELLVTEYPVGSVINWHRDAPPFDVIAGISLLSDCVFRFRPYDKKQQNRKAIISFPLERRSLYVINGESRTTWEHSIPAIKQNRFSITLRT